MAPWPHGHASWFLRDALPDFPEQLAAAGRVAPLLARQETGLGLAFGDDVRDEVVEQPLHARPRIPRHAQQGLVP